MRHSVNRLTPGKILQWIKDFYEQSNELIAYLLLIVIGVLQYVNVDWIQKGLPFALGFVILTTLFEIRKVVAKKHTAELDYFSYWPDAVTAIKNSIEEVSSTEEELNIRILAVALRHAWDDTIFPFLNQLSSDKKYQDLSSISIEIAIIDSNWLKERKDMYDFDGYLYGKYFDRSVANKSGIDAYKIQHGDFLKQNNINIEVYMYKHMPNIYGILINDRIFYRGICNWILTGKQPSLEGAEGEYELYVKGDTFKGSQKIMEFNSWFEYCKKYSVSQAQVE